MSILLNNPLKKKQITRNGLVMWLDGKDFSNSQSTTLWKDRSQGIIYSITNLVTNGDFNNGTSSWTTGAASLSVSNGEATVTATSQYGSLKSTSVAETLVSNHIYYASAYVKANSNLVKLDVKRSAGSDTLVKAHSGSGLYEKLTAYGNIGTVSTGNGFYVLDFRASGWDSFYVKQAMLVDLTAMFGSGNEPSSDWCLANLNFINGTGSVVKGNDATLANFAYTTSSGSDNNGGIAFDGTDDFCYINKEIFTNLSSITIEFSFTPLSISLKDRNLINFYGAVTFFITKTTVLTPVFRCWVDSNNVSFATAQLNPMQKYYITIKWDGTVFAAYINGVLANSISMVGSLLGKPSTILNSTIGNTSDVILKNMRIYNRALTDSEILQNYKATK